MPAKADITHGLEIDHRLTVVSLKPFLLPGKSGNDDHLASGVPGPVHMVADELISLLGDSVMTKNQLQYKVDEKFDRLTPVSKEELTALENAIVADGEIFNPIVVWQGQEIVVDGHSRLQILKKHPKLKYTVKEVVFKDWQEVMIWIVEHHISRRSFTLWQKLEMALNCEEYWAARAEAKKNQGTRTDLKSPGDKKSQSVDVNQIIADKVGCGKTTVTMFKTVFQKASETVKQQCREGSKSIKSAYESLPGKKEKKHTSKPTQVTVSMDPCDLWEECENNIDVGKKKLLHANGVPMNSEEMVDRMYKAKVADGAVWVVLYKQHEQMLVMKKNVDKQKGVACVKVNAYLIKALCAENGVVIFEADHINGGVAESVRKDDSEFEANVKLAS